MKEIRDIKIDLLTGNKNPIVDLFNEITKDTMIIKCDVYHKHGLEFIYHKDGEWIFYQHCQNGEFWCNYTRYWSLFESNLKLEHGEIQAITKYLVEEALKREVDTPLVVSSSFTSLVEEALKREVDTPTKYHIEWRNWVMPGSHVTDLWWETEKTKSMNRDKKLNELGIKDI